MVPLDSPDPKDPLETQGAPDPRDPAAPLAPEGSRGQMVQRDPRAVGGLRGVGATKAPTGSPAHRG